jgi:hypothetical protein
MCRVLVLSATVLLAQTAFVLAQPSAIIIDGQVAGGNFVTATCTVGKAGQITGSGVLYGTNPGTGANYKYPFTISQGSTATGKLVLTGKMAAGPAVTLSATVPAGDMVFSYVVNGKTVSLAGKGSVTVK